MSAHNSANHDALLGRTSSAVVDELVQVISRHYHGGSIVLMANRDITDRGHIFDTVVASMLDRHPHHATVVQINGPSYRVRRHQARLDQLRHRGTQSVVRILGNRRFHSLPIA